MVIYLCSGPPERNNPSLIVRKTSEFLIEGHSTKDAPLLSTVKAINSKGSWRKYHSQEQPKETWPLDRI
jgi:hypothetical protein